MVIRKSYCFIIPVLMLLLVGASSISCSSFQPTQSSTPTTGGVSRQTVEPKQTSTPKAGGVSQQTVDKGDPDWWKKQPDLKKEETAINETITTVRAAFTAKDTETVLKCIAPDDREKFKGVFSKSPDIMPQIAKDIEKASLSFLSLDTQDTADRIAEYTMKVDGNTFYIVFIKVDGKWLIKNF
jgi:hypothetical protein